MTLKAAWITPLRPGGPYTLTLESAEVGPGQQLNVHEHTFPLTPVDAPKRHTVALTALDEADLDMLRRLLDTAQEPSGYGYERTTVRKDEDQPGDFE